MIEKKLYKMEWFGGLGKLKKNGKMKQNGIVEMGGANKWLVQITSFSPALRACRADVK